MFKAGVLRSPLAVAAPRPSKMTVLAAPLTGHHTVTDSLRDEAAAFFFEGASLPLKFTPTTGGVCVL